MVVGCMKWCVLVHLLWIGRSRAPLARHRLVVTTQGPARGYYYPRPPHYSFLGLPYARPPTRRDRFKAPRSPVSWSGIFEAVHRVRCPQPDGSGEENCLVINVLAPEHGTLLPVIVHFHGGRFRSGWGSYRAPAKFLERNIVYVTFNYRLGALGFLCLRSESIPGNAGLKDQVAALYWIQRNIEKFGGNPSDVTAYGTGSGAVAIELLLLSGLIKDLFHKAILESGSALSPSSMSYDPLADAMDFAGNLGFESDANIDKFFLDLSLNELINTSRTFLPCIERESRLSHSLLEKDPREILRNIEHKIPMMIVYTNAEEVSLITNDIDRFTTVPEDLDLLPSNLAFDDEETRTKIAKHVKDFYFDEIELRENIIRSYIAYINDIFIEYPIVKSAANYAKHGNPVYLMKFMYKGKLSQENLISGASSGDIHAYVSVDGYSDYDGIVNEILVTLWSNFITLGDPTPLTTPLITEIWEPVTASTVDGEVVLKNIPCLMFRRSVKNEELTGQQYVFWDRIYNKFYIRPPN